MDQLNHSQLVTLIKQYNCISAEEEEAIQHFFRPQKVKKKRILIHQKEPCNELYFVNSGILRAYTTKINGGEVTRSIAWENRFISNMISFKDFSENEETIECVENAEILTIQREDFCELLSKFPNLKCIYNDILEQYNALNIKRFHHLMLNNIPAKIELLRIDYPQLIPRLNDSLLASFLGISRETFVRHKNIYFRKL